MYSLIDLTKKKIIVAGASQGIGQATAILLGRLGAEVILVARNEEGLKDTLSQMEGEGHCYWSADLSDTSGIDNLVKEIIQKQGPIDGLVYAAGISDNRPLTQMRPEIVESVMRINLGGFIEMVRCVSRKGRFRPGMSIVGISSTAAFIGTKAHEAYAASKAGMNGAVKCMAKELHEKKIRINTVAPGMIRTKMYEDYLLSCGGEDSNAVRGLLSTQYLGIGEPQDVANAIAFLLSSASNFITGISLPVDGGSLS